MTFRKYWLFLIICFSILGAKTQALTPLSFENETSTTETYAFPPMDNAPLRAASLSQASEATAVQYAQPRQVLITPNLEQSTLIYSQNTAENMLVWRQEIHSPGAESINLGFTQYFMPEGGALFIYTPDRAHIIRAFTAEDNEDHGQLWTPMLPGDRVVIELNIPHHIQEDVQLELTRVNHGFLGRTPDEVREIVLLSGSCNIDVVCPAGDNWRKQIRSVAAYSTGGGLFCTGSALNNTASDGRGFFLTANHCGIRQSNAPSMVVYWNYENSYCRQPGSGDSGGNGDGRLTEFNTGAIFRARYEASDMTLVELDDPFDPEHNVYLSGWDARANVPSSAVGIHHPRVDEKRISFENNPLRTSSYGGGSGQTHLQVIDWDLGTTEPGSSGSPLFDQNQRIVGQLHGGSAACGNNGSDWYGWLNTSWTGGGTSSSRLSDWLDATGTGLMVVDGREAAGGGGGNPDPKLENGVPITEISLSQNQNRRFEIDIPSGASDLTFEIQGQNGDADLYVRFGSAPTTSNYDCRPYKNGSSETCDFSVPQTGTYYVMVNAYSSFNNLSLTASYNTNGGGGGGEDQQNTNINVSQGEWFFHDITVPSGTSRLVVTSSGGSGDADLYIWQTPFNGYACQSRNNNNSERCVVNNPAAGSWRIGLYGYNSASGITEIWSFE